MKLTCLFFAILLFWGVQGVRAQESVEVQEADKEQVAQNLEKEAQSGKYDDKTKEMLGKVANLFRDSKGSHEVEAQTKQEDCPDCSRQQKAKSFFSKLGRALGKGAAWVSTTTAKPFMSAAAFVKGAVEKEDKNKELVALYQFFLNHQSEFDNLYLEAGTPEEMIELMLAKMEEITEKKSRIIMKDFLASLGINKEIPEDLSTFELSAEEIAKIDESKIDPAFVNKHPEYQELKPLLGEMTKQEIMDIVTSGYFDKAISFVKEGIPSVYELAGTVVGQIFVPKIALGIVSKTLAGLYTLPVVAADIGTGVSTAICLQKENQEKFKDDKDLKMFCSYVVNRSGYELMKSRAKGYIAGKKFHHNVGERIKRIKEKRAEKKRLKEQKKKEQQAKLELAEAA